MAILISVLRTGSHGWIQLTPAPMLFPTRCCFYLYLLGSILFLKCFTATFKDIKNTKKHEITVVQVRPARVKMSHGSEQNACIFAN